MLYVLLIYEKPDDFARRDSSVESDAYAGAWRAYHRAMLDAGIFVGVKPLDAPETATVAALTTWPRDGIPKNPQRKSESWFLYLDSQWLLTTLSRVHKQLIDLTR